MKKYLARTDSVTFSFTTSVMALAVAAAASMAPTALAQDKGGANSALALEEIIVTARKRSESIQDVPVSVTSISQELQEASLRRLDDIQSFTPNVYIRTTSGIPGGAAISIRGVSYQETDKTLDPSIGVIMDGLYLGTSSGSLLTNFDVKQIEVLRGPQGTLFGKNTTGGVLNIIRGDVTQEWGGDFSVTVGDDGRQDVKGVLNVPVIEDQLGVKLFGNKIESDGWIENTTINEDAFGDDKQTYGFATLWTPTETFDLKLHYEHNDDNTDTGAYANVNQPGQDLVCSIEGIFYPIGCESSDTGSDEDHNSTNGRNTNNSEYDTYIMTMNWDVGPVLLTSITGQRDMDEQYRIEFDGGPAEFLSFDYTNDWEQFSQELLLTSQFSETYEFVAGLYYWDVDYQQRWNVYELLYNIDRIGGIVPGVPGGAGFTPDTTSYNGQDQETTSYAAYTQGDWNINDQWTLTAGVRYTYEEKDFLGGDGAIYTRGEPLPELPQRAFDDDWDEVTSKLGFSYQYDDNIMLFGSWSEGFKSGGFFGRQANFDLDPTYDPEYVEVWEMGVKSSWMDNRIIFNPTVFYNDYTDKQEDVLIPINLTNVATAIRNASTLEIFGIETELQFQATEAWNIRASYGYLDAKYKDYYADLTGSGEITDNSDIIPRNTPENTVGLSTTYTIPVGPGEIVAFASYRWRDAVEVIANNDPLGSLESIENLDLTLNYIWNDSRYRVSAYGRNVTDERERVVTRIPDLVTWGAWNQGANYGVEFAVSF